MLAAFHEAHRLAQNLGKLLFQLGSETLDLIFPQRNYDFMHGVGRRKLPQRVHQDRNAAELFELLGRGFLAAPGRRSLHPRAQPGRGNNDKYLHKGAISIVQNSN